MGLVIARKIPIIFFIISFIVVFASRVAIPESDHPPVAKTGAPMETSCATTNCHTGAITGGSISFTFGNNDSTYRISTNYMITVTVDDMSQLPAGLFGFEMTALNSSNNAAGFFTVITPANTWDSTAFGRNYIAHKNATDNNSWTFSYQAPPTNVGVISFYIAANAANGNGDSAGDNIYKTSFTIDPDPKVGIEQRQLLDDPFMITYPLTALKFINVAYTMKHEGFIKVDVVDIHGRFVRSLVSARQHQGHFKESFHLNALSPGFYFLIMETADQIYVKRLPLL